MNCNLVHPVWLKLLPLVSIPNRDFDELQFNVFIDIIKIWLVSIPNRDFDELQYVFIL